MTFMAASRAIGGCRPFKLAPFGLVPPNRGSLGFNEKWLEGGPRRFRPGRAGELTVVETDRKKEEVDAGSVLGDWAVSAIQAVKLVVVKRGNLGRHHVEFFIERGITNCRFFTIMSVAGSVIGSILCFVEGCFFVIESFFEYYHNNMQQIRPNNVEMARLIEALDLFLVGTALYMFGAGMFLMFLGTSELKQSKGIILPSSGLFDHKRLQSTVVMRTVSEAKTKIGHSMMIVLQAGVLEKFKNVPVTNAVDLACFSGAILVSSLSIFLLSRISHRNKHKKDNELI